MHHDAHRVAKGISQHGREILRDGFTELLRKTQDMAFQRVVSERYPLPLAVAVYGEVPDPEWVRDEVRKGIEADPLSQLESSLVLLELWACNRPTLFALVPDDDAFLTQVFASKRINGWMALLGDSKREDIQRGANARWQFRFFSGEGQCGGLYVLLNILARYAFVYGRVPCGDMHLLGHFVEDYTSGLVVGCGSLSELELALSLAAMRMGVPAVMPGGYPFTLGRWVAADSVEEIVSAIASLPNIRRLLEHPEIPALPAYLQAEQARPLVQVGQTWGHKPESFYLLRKGQVRASGVSVTGTPGSAMGILLTVDAEPLDAFDRRYIESRAARIFSRMPGVSGRYASGRLVLDMARDFSLPPERIGESLIAAVRNEFPRIVKLHAEVIFEPERLKALANEVAKERIERKREIAATTEESITEFVTCVGCSAFAPDHVCILTPERQPQCGRPYEFIKTGALYGYDDMTNIHHRELHAGVNSFGTCPKGDLLDSGSGEWSGVNQAAARLTGGRITRVQLHSLDHAPHTGCGCFQLILFKTQLPKPGIGVMERGYHGRAPDGRTWRDLHYALGGKQAPGLAGASWSYLHSAKFLAAHGGRKSIVWASPKVASLLPVSCG